MNQLRMLDLDTPFTYDTDEENQEFTNLFPPEDYEDKTSVIDIFEIDQPTFFNNNFKHEIDLTPSEINKCAETVINNGQLDEQLNDVDISGIELIGNVSWDSSQFLSTINISCEECVTYKQVNIIRDIKKGDHIRFHKNFIGVNVYNHHAIVTDISYCDVFKGEVTLVHFQKDSQRNITVIKENKPIDVSSENIDVAQYNNLPFTVEEIIARADQMAAKFNQGKQRESYSLAANNCEDKSNEIATGVKYSQQSESKARYVKSTVVWLMKSLLMIAIKCCQKNSTVIRKFTHIVVIAALITIVDQMASIKHKLAKGLLCKKCYNKANIQLTASLIFCLISVGISIMFNMSSVYSAITTAIAFALPRVSSFLIDTILPIIQPLSAVPKPVVRRSDMIRPGDIITFPYNRRFHDGVVTHTELYREEKPDIVKITVVHFSYPGLFKKRTIVQEDLYLNFKKHNIHVYDFSKKDTFKKLEVVKRATDCLGDQHFNALSNNSSHFSRNCKVGEKKLETVPCNKVSTITDINEGDVINFSYCWLPHDAVVTQVNYPETVKCRVIHFQSQGSTKEITIGEENCVFNLADQNVFVHDYSGFNVYMLSEVVERAKDRQGYKKDNIFSNRSSHFARWCKIKENGD